VTNIVMNNEEYVRSVGNIAGQRVVNKYHHQVIESKNANVSPEDCAEHLIGVAYKDAVSC
jgi:hypothetical protein